MRLEAYSAKTSARGHYELIDSNGDAPVLSFKLNDLDANIEDCVKWLDQGFRLVWVEEEKPKKKK